MCLSFSEEEFNGTVKCKNFKEKKERKKVTSFPYSAGVKKAGEREKRDLEGYRMSYIFS